MGVMELPENSLAFAMYEWAKARQNWTVAELNRRAAGVSAWEPFGEIFWEYVQMQCSAGYQVRGLGGFGGGLGGGGGCLTRGDRLGSRGQSVLPPGVWKLKGDPLVYGLCEWAEARQDWMAAELKQRAAGVTACEALGEVYWQYAQV